MTTKRIGLFGNGLLRRRHHRHAARVALAALDNEDVVAHVDGERRVVAADLEDTLAELLDRGRRRLPAGGTRARPAAARCRRAAGLAGGGGGVSSAVRFGGFGVADVMVASNVGMPACL